jgi:streptomycin 6-kinase
VPQTEPVTRPIELPEIVQQKARALGDEGEQWLRDLPAIVEELAIEWDLDVGSALAGGSGAFVAPATDATGDAAILKVAMPDGLEGQAPFASELHALELGAGRGFVRVLRADVDRRAVLQERLGRSLQSLGLPVEAQIDAIADTLRAVWQPAPADDPLLRSGYEQAEFLEMFVLTRWEALDRPCPSGTIRQACEYAHARRDSFDADRTVLIHGDAHHANVLEAPDGGFRLIDPDAMRSEPAHDLGIPLRGWSYELLASGDATRQGRAWCDRLATRAGADPTATWQWAFIERVSSGLFLLELGARHDGARMLAVADEWAATPAS